jgi:hypothetical protein
MEIPICIIAKTKNLDVRPNLSWLGLVAKNNSQSNLPPLMEQVWRNKKIVSKGWKFPLLPRQDKFGPKSEKYLKLTFFFR